jgi:hypothetical protein
MTDTLNQTELAQIVSAVLAALNTSNSSTPKAASISAPVDTLAQKDRALIAGFKRKGIPADQIVLMDRANPAKPFNVKPFKAWLEQGQQVRRGEKSIKGLFHQSQTDLIAKASAKPAITTEQKTLFDQAKKVLKAKKAKAQPRPAA